MPTLDNAKHELFAQGIAKGLSQRDAYCKAGYTQSKSPDVTDAAASRLLRDVRVSARVTELQNKAADRTTYDLAWFLQQGADLFEKARDAGDHTAASAQYQRLATIAGVWVEKTDNTNKSVVRDVSDKPLTAQEWAEQHTTTH